MKKINTFLILSSDRLSQQAKTFLNLNDRSVMILIDKSNKIKRIFKLVFRRRLSVALILKMLLCELRRPRENFSSPDSTQIFNNYDLLLLIKKYKPQRIILFRTGLIINSKVIASGIPLLNIHCARLPDYSGLGAIAKAIKENANNQCATLHEVTTSIDKGKVLDVEPYLINQFSSYCENEMEAYRAGINLLSRTLSSGIKLKHDRNGQKVD